MAVTDAETQKEIETQRAYYAQTAHLYDDMHVHEEGEHELALRFMISMIQYLGIRSVLDIGSGTGRGLSRLKLVRLDIPRDCSEPNSSRATR